MARAPKRQITWTVDRKADPAPKSRQYFPDAPVDEPMREAFERSLVLGAMFFLRTQLRVLPDGNSAPGPHPYVGESWYTLDPVAGEKGNMAIYAGEVRVEESTGRSLIRVPRHSFIINGGRYLVTNLNWFEPIFQMPPGAL